MSDLDKRLDEIRKQVHLYGDICGQHQSAVHFGRYTIAQRNEAIRTSAKNVMQSIKQLITEAVNTAVIIELGHIQLQYGHQLAQTMAGGEWQTIQERIQELKEGK
jgi:hypothetical protein